MIKLNDYSPTFCMVASNQIKSSSDYRVLVSLNKSPSKPVDALIRLHGDIDNGSEVGSGLNEIKTIVLDNTDAKEIVFNIGQLVHGQYKIKVTLSGGLVYEEEKILTLLETKCTIFIQTDKSVYKPEQKVLFRVVAVNPSLKPVHKPIDISIKVSFNHYIIF